jgi:predicted phage tail protein
LSSVRFDSTVVENGGREAGEGEGAIFLTYAGIIGESCFASAMWAGGMLGRSVAAASLGASAMLMSVELMVGRATASCSIGL